MLYRAVSSPEKRNLIHRGGVMNCNWGLYVAMASDRPEPYTLYSMRKCVHVYILYILYMPCDLYILYRIAVQVRRLLICWQRLMTLRKDVVVSLSLLFHT